MMTRTTRISRRHFLASTAGAVSFSVLPSGSFGADGTSPTSKLDIAFIGMGSQIQGRMSELLSLGHNAAALCDVDENQIAKSRAKHGDAAAKATAYTDYRRLFEKETSLDAVVIATPDHWHATICRLALQAKKHVYCEKPLTHTIAESRRLRELSRQSDVVTQTGNQGSASPNLRRSIELIEAGIFGQITDIYIWHPVHAWAGDQARLDQSDPIPKGLNWDFWCGPSKVRPYKQGVYHPHHWRSWFDYGNGFVGDFCCHAFNMPVRALKLEYPDRIAIKGTKLGYDCYPASSRIRYRFPARGDLAPVTMHVYDGGLYPEHGELDVLLPTFGKRPRVGCLLVGEKGHLSAGLWNSDCYVKMKDEQKFRGAGTHPLAQTIPQRLPRVSSHIQEWVDAIQGGPKPFADFDLGGHLTEIGLAGNVALRLQKDIEWDGPNMKVVASKEADPFVHKTNREQWL